MKEELLKLLNNSYAKYSKFKVAAIVVMKDGKTFKGVNVENASYGAAICAERNAISTAITEGYTKGSFKDLYIMADSKIIATPCFMCRQVISELFNKDANIICMNNTGKSMKFKVKELCPYPFDEDNLK